MEIIKKVEKLLKYSQELSILYVEDDAGLREGMEMMLQTLFKEVETAVDGEEGLTKYNQKKFDVILTDISMPKMNGLDMIKAIREIDPEQKVVALSAHNESDILINLIQVGVHSFILKPSTQETIVDTLLPICRDAYNQQLNIEYILQLNKEILETQKEVVLIMGGVAEAKSKETGMHVQRVAHYSRLLGELTGMDQEEAELLQMASPMHDIGKIGIPDHILHKPGEFEPDEWEIMQTHAQLGYDILKISDRPILKAAALIAKDHHEKWDGSGYPESKSGEEIHIYGRITAIADVFDALGSDRVYKKAWELDKILDLFRAERSKHFDPILIDLFFDNLDQFLVIREKFKEE